MTVLMCHKSGCMVLLALQVLWQICNTWQGNWAHVPLLISKLWLATLAEAHGVP